MKPTDLNIRPAARGEARAIGSRLLDEVVARASKRGCARLMLVSGRSRESGGIPV